MAKVLIIDDDPGVCWALRKTLEEAGHAVDVAGTAEQGLPRADAAELVFLDIGLPGMDGLQALDRLPGKPVVIITAHGTLDNAVEALQRGAFDYLVKPLRSEEIPALVERAVKRTELEKEVTRLREELGGGSRLVGASRAMQEVFKQVATAALSDAPVLIRGEPGTGRELVARAIHAASSRKEAPFVVNAGRFLPPDLPVEGTLFLDEVGELTEDARARLARDEPWPRLIASTSKDLDRDLHLRLAATEIHVPPLRARRADVPLLVAHFLEREFRYPSGIGTAAMAILEAYDWPDNVRELRNAIESATVRARGAAIEPDHLPARVRQVPKPADDEVARVVARLAEHARDGQLHETVLGAFERALLEQVLEESGGNQVQSAKRLGIHRTTLRKLIDRYRL